MLLRTLSLLLCSAAILPAANKLCPGAVPAGTFRIRVTSTANSTPIPIRQVNTIQAGYKITAETLQLPPDAGKNPRIALVVLPAESGRAVTVLDLKPTDSPAEWTMPFQPSVLLLVFGPQGLDEKRVINLVSKDEDLVAELAGYADQTQELEANIDSLLASENEDQEDPIARLRNGTPSEQALFTLVRALNPSSAAYNPIAGGKRAGPATMMGRASSTFFENAGGTFPGSGALPAMKSWLMPDTDFRTVYSEAVDSNGLTLCTQRVLSRNRNRAAYIWGYRLNNAPPPQYAWAGSASVPLSSRSTVAVKSSPADWALADRVRNWNLVASNGTRTPVRVRPVQRSFELDLRRSQIGTGTYRLVGDWDWQPLTVAGDLTVAPLGEMSRAQLSPVSQRLLNEGAGVVPVRLEGADFQFVERMTLRRPGWTAFNPVDLDFSQPTARRTGPLNALDFEVDTRRLRAGEYLIALQQSGGATQDVPLRVLPSSPRIDSLPLRIGTGDGQQRVLLRGAGLDRIDSIECDNATVQLSPGTPEQREAVIVWRSAAKADDRFPLRLRLLGAGDPVTVPNALVALAPRARITAARLSPPEENGTALRDGELPAGSFVGMTLTLDHADPQAAVRFECSDRNRTIETLRIRPGERTATARLQVLSDTSYFASLDPGAAGQPGCTLTAALDSDLLGTSPPASLGRVVRLPRIESFAFTDEKSGDNAWIAVLRGRDLETIERAGWDPANGLPINAAPRTAAGEGDRQTLRIALPWPSPRPLAPLYVWLRGDTQGRAVKLK